jgi:hypothetical protein
VDPIAVLDNVEKRKFLTLSGLEPRPLRGPVRSPSLYRRRYLAVPKSLVQQIIHVLFQL